jgi:hypothetical protein
VHGISRALSAAFKKPHIKIIWNQTGSEKEMRKQLKRGRKKNKGNKIFEKVGEKERNEEKK